MSSGAQYYICSVIAANKRNEHAFYKCWKKCRIGRAALGVPDDRIGQCTICKRGQ